MNTINLAATNTTPGVVLDPARKILEFSGQSYPENAVQFYQGVHQKLEAYLEENSEPLTVDFKLDYFNTSTSKCLLDLLECLERGHQRGRKITVNWYYFEEDEDMHDSGVDFSLEIKLPFNLIAVKQKT
jgi:SiaC family regulatory phosphoprotein